MLSFDQLTQAVASCRHPVFTFRLGSDGIGTDQPWMQIRATTPDALSGKPYEWGGRKWRISWHMTVSEVVQTCFLAVLQAVEHEAREDFKYRGRAIFDPHYDVTELWTLHAAEKALSKRDVSVKQDTKV